MEFKGRANVVEVNRYHFIIEAETKEEAQQKLEEHLKKNVPIPNDNIVDGVRCHDIDPSWETRETESIEIK